MIGGEARINDVNLTVYSLTLAFFFPPPRIAYHRAGTVMEDDANGL